MADFGTSRWGHSIHLNLQHNLYSSFLDSMEENDYEESDALLDFFIFRDALLNIVTTTFRVFFF